MDDKGFAYKEGYKAFNEGSIESDCPYDVETDYDNHLSWMVGFYDAEYATRHSRAPIIDRTSLYESQKRTSKRRMNESEITNEPEDGVCDCGRKTKYTFKQLAERDGYDPEEIADFADYDPENFMCPNCYIGIRDEWNAWREAEKGPVTENKKKKTRINEAITRKAKERLNLLNDIVNFAYEYGENETKSLFQQAFKKAIGDDLVDSLNEDD